MKNIKKKYIKDKEKKFDFECHILFFVQYLQFNYRIYPFVLKYLVLWISEHFSFAIKYINYFNYN